MSQENVEIVRRAYAAWEHGDYSPSDWADIPGSSTSRQTALRLTAGQGWLAWRKAGVTS